MALILQNKRKKFCRLLTNCMGISTFILEDVDLFDFFHLHQPS